MTKISREQVDILIDCGILINECGQYKELKITGKGKRKNYYVPDYFLKRCKNKK